MSLHFEPEPGLRDVIEFRRREIFAQLGSLVPFAELEHIGSTAVPNGWTSGDVDVQVRVDTPRLATAQKEIGSAFERVEGGDSQLSLYKHEGRGVRIYLTVKGGDHDNLVLHRDLLRDQPLLRERYDAMKRRFRRGDPEAYRAAKADFWAEYDREAKALYRARLARRR